MLHRIGAADSKVSTILTIDPARGRLLRHLGAKMPTNTTCGGVLLPIRVFAGIMAEELPT